MGKSGTSPQAHPRLRPGWFRKDHPAERVGSARRIPRRGQIDQHWSDWFDDLTVTHTDQNETALTGPIVDQAALHDLLAKLRDLGLLIVSVNLSEEEDQAAATE